MIPKPHVYPVVSYQAEITTNKGRTFTRFLSCPADWTIRKVIDQLFYELPTAEDVRIVAIASRRQQWTSGRSRSR